MELKFRAFIAEGITHGGGGLTTGQWRDSYEEAQEDLDKLERHFDDSFYGVEADSPVQNVNKTLKHMRLAHVKKRVKEIYDAKDDPEKAHRLEDELHVNFIRFISQFGSYEDSKLAEEILKTKLIDFDRWCA